MKKVTMKAEHRKVLGKKVKALRREGKLPAIIYGGEIEPTPIVLDVKETRSTLTKIGANTLVTIKIKASDDFGHVIIGYAFFTRKFVSIY